MLQAQRDSLLQAVSNEQNVSRVFYENIQNNPALKERSESQLTQIRFSADQQLQDDQLISYQGKNQQRYSFLAKSKITLKNTNLWGKAHYVNQTTEHKNWCLVADPERIYPYFLADTVGGHNYAEKYGFEGGINFNQNRSTIGLEMKYNAQHHHGETDPRPLNRVFDIGTKLGYAYNFSEYKNLGISLNYSSYRQFASVRNFREDRKDYFYFLKGFGQYHHKLSETNSQENIKYFGHTVGGNLNWNDTQAKVLVQLNILGGKMEQIHENKYIPFYSNDMRFDAVFSKEFSAGKNSFILTAKHSYLKRKGTEVLFERVKVNDERAIFDWNFLTSANRFRALQNLSQLDVLFITDQKRTFSQTMQLNMAFLQKNENFYEPDFLFSYSSLFADWAHTLSQKKRKTNLSLTYGLNYKYILSKESDLANESLTEQIFLQDAENERKNAYQARLLLQIDFALKKSVLFVRPHASFTQVGDVNIWNLSLTTGVII